jgi:putative hydrolase of the HAD superfamily
MPMGMTLQKEEEAPDFTDIEAWVFDLDNTLYHAGTNVFTQIDARMTEYVSRLLDLSPKEAKAVQHAYYRAYGTTLNGLMAIHHIDPDDYLAYVHNIDLSVLQPDPKLKAALKQLPGRLIVFTNGSSEHAERILKRLEIHDMIETIFDIRRSSYIPKPSARAYRRLIGQTAIDPWVSAFFEDLARNLVPAHELGMTTVWLNNTAHWGQRDPGFSSASREYIDFETTDLASFLMSLRT